MKLEDSTAYTARCFHGEPASCSYACPFRMDIRAFLEKASKGRWLPAYKTFRNAAVFPVIVSILCDQPCRAHCQRTLLGDEAIALRDLEVACIRYAKNRKPESYYIPPKDKRIAIVGAGVAGLSCALNLAQKKFLVTVFEKEEGWGGSLRSHPRFTEFDADIALQFSTVKAEFRFGTEIQSLDELPEFDAVYVATGSGGNSFGLFESWEGDLFTTSAPKVFMGGELCGAALIEGIAQGIKASLAIEVFLQTGKAARTYNHPDKNYCDRYLDHNGKVSVPLVEASSPDGYTEEEAKAEASRCLQCDCVKCMAACEMLKRFRKNPHKIAVEVFNDMGVNPPFSVHTLTREVYSCNICGYCKSICPESVDMGALLQFSRAARMSAGIHPIALHDFWLREMDFAASEGSFASAPKGKASCEYAFYPGCRLGASNPGHVLKSYDFLLQKYGAGIILGCCGAPAYWAGDETRLRTNIERIRQDWSNLGKPTLIFACATCEGLFHLFLPEIKRISLYEVLAEADEITPAHVFAEAAVFDPCAARGDNAMQSGIRKLAGKAGIALEELREPNRCCGYGGHMRIANPSLYEEITQNRAEASEKPYIVYCANCKEVFASRRKECAHALDMVFGLRREPGIPSLEEKRNNSLIVKRELMKKNRDIDFKPEIHEWDSLKLIISDELLESMNNKLISAADLREAIWLAENSGDRFYDERDGMCICSMIKPVITYWVQYRETAPKTYEIFSAYYHRMRFNEE
ncbi:MAG: FAD-dependent oxidoreductase [Acidobacteria bacterium]|nr:FAD-dependent oxidoreductase [Acidobacteriota bacterium]